MHNVKALKEQIAAKEVRLSAIAQLAVDEKRELSKEEILEIDNLQGVGAEGGELAKLEMNLARAVKLESIEKKIAAERLTTRESGAIGLAMQSDSRIVVPTYRGKLKSFSGPEAGRDAYIAGQFFGAVLFNRESSKQWLADHGMPVQMAHSTTDNEKGGYLVPETVEAGIIRLVEEFGVFRSNVGSVWTVNGKTSVPKRGAGFTVYHVGENQEITKSDLGFKNVSVDPRKAAVLTQIANELPEAAAINLGDLLTQEFALALAYDEDNAGFNGDGSNAFNNVVGLKSSLLAGAIHVPTGTGKTTPADFTLNDFVNAIGKLKRYPGMVPRWFVHSQVYYESMAPLQLAAGGNTVSDIASGGMPMFAGYPVQFAQAMPNTAAAGVQFAYLGDLSMAAVMAEGRTLTIASDSSLYFAEDALAVRCTELYDIVVHDIGTSTAGGSVVALKTTAS